MERQSEQPPVLSYRVVVPRRGVAGHSAEGITAFFWACSVLGLVLLAMVLPWELKPMCAVLGAALSCLTPPMAFAGLSGRGCRQWMAVASLPILVVAWALAVAWVMG